MIFLLFFCPPFSLLLRQLAPCPSYELRLEDGLTSFFSWIEIVKQILKRPFSVSKY